MSTDPRRDAVLGAAGLVQAFVTRDPVFVAAALRQGDTAALCEVLAGWLADAVRTLDEQRARMVVAGFPGPGPRRRRRRLGGLPGLSRPVALRRLPPGGAVGEAVGRGAPR